MIIVVFACLGLLVGVLTGVTSSPFTTTCTSPKLWYRPKFIHVTMSLAVTC